MSPVDCTRKVDIAGVNPPKIAVARLKAKEKPTTRTFCGMTSVNAATIAPLYMPKKNEKYSKTTNNRSKLGASASQCMAGYAVKIHSSEIANSSGRRPIRSEIAPPMGNQMKLVRPTNNVTTRLSVVLKCSTVLPNVGVYTVIR